MRRKYIEVILRSSDTLAVMDTAQPNYSVFNINVLSEEGAEDHVDLLSRLLCANKTTIGQTGQLWYVMLS